MKNVVSKQLLSENDGSDRRKVSMRHVNQPKNVPVSAFFNKVVHLLDLPVALSFGEIDPNIRTTNGRFSITYNPEGSPKRVRNKPYTIGQDLLACRICVSGPGHFYSLSRRIPELGWIVRWSTLEDDLFALAKQHPGITFYFDVNWVKYGRMIEKKAEEMGIDIDHKPFVCYITTKKKMDEIRSKFLMNPKRTKEDIINEIQETDKEYNI
jgi:hypothetical protein